MAQNMLNKKSLLACCSFNMKETGTSKGARWIFENAGHGPPQLETPTDQKDQKEKATEALTVDVGEAPGIEKYREARKAITDETQNKLKKLKETEGFKVQPS